MSEVAKGAVVARCPRAAELIRDAQREIAPAADLRAQILALAEGARPWHVPR